VGENCAKVRFQILTKAMLDSWQTCGTYTSSPTLHLTIIIHYSALKTQRLHAKYRTAVLTIRITWHLA